jgi:hypothetical protein
MHRMREHNQSMLRHRNFNHDLSLLPRLTAHRYLRQESYPVLWPLLQFPLQLNYRQLDLISILWEPVQPSYLTRVRCQVKASSQIPDSELHKSLPFVARHSSLNEYTLIRPPNSICRTSRKSKSVRYACRTWNSRNDKIRDTATQLKALR